MPQETSTSAVALTLPAGVMAGVGRAAAGDALATCLFMAFFSLAAPVSGPGAS